MRTKITIDGHDAALILLAAGSSTRMGATGKKEFLKMCGAEKGAVISVAANVFFKSAHFSTVAIAYPKGELDNAKKAFYSSKETSEIAKGLNVIFVPGGDTRQKSVLLALKAIEKNCKKNGADLPDTVLIHDGARPFLSSGLVKAILKAAKKYGAAAPALEPVETQKEIDSQKKNRAPFGAKEFGRRTDSARISILEDSAISHRRAKGRSCIYRRHGNLGQIFT